MQDFPFIPIRFHLFPFSLMFLLERYFRSWFGSPTERPSLLRSVTSTYLKSMTSGLAPELAVFPRGQRSGSPEEFLMSPSRSNNSPSYNLFWACLISMLHIQELQEKPGMARTPELEETAQHLVMLLISGISFTKWCFGASVPFGDGRELDGIAWSFFQLNLVLQWITFSA